MEIQVWAAPVNISREVALMHGLIEPTPEERAEAERSRVDWDARYAADRVTYEAALMALDGLTDPAVRAVLELHAPNTEGWSVECSHCYRDTELGDYEDWPCQTVSVVAEVHAIALPKYGVRSA